MSTQPVLLTFLNNVPLPLTTLLVHLAPYISFLRYIAQILAWKAPWYHSFLALLLWCYTCLLGEFTLRYFLPLLVFLIFTLVPFTRTTISLPLVTELTLQATIADLHTIQSLLPAPPSIPEKPALVRVLLLLYIPYLILTYLLHLRTVIAILGSLLLTYRAPWAIVLRGLLWRSAHLRWLTYSIWSQLSGHLMLPDIPRRDVSAIVVKPVSAIRFLFTIYENQRWWMGLDWTAALLPGERPSWCSLSQQPASPPNAFSLPKPTAVFLLDNQGKRVRRTATWRWEEPEWRVLVRRNVGGLNRVERPLPGLKEDGTGRLLKGKRRDSSSQSLETSGKEPIDSQEYVMEDVEDTRIDECLTDPDGWVYGDNKWENQSSKGGMGKYTRYRRWTRIATVQEIIETVDDKTAGLATEDLANQPSSGENILGSPTEFEADTSSHQRDSGLLRQRLKDIVNMRTASTDAQED
ncbi:hypothetical protein AMATHDRAFT_2483 [Amanita thiersii Skay4041]|uniref:Peroxin/Ferlin domain-containing protein n=1 Tax=Amanita thiersii Skay4041 TaxID=703135 RepID=A0A2A9NRN5_9AGAR|nr:hypothetical protein AMATHDRAFT_2483 [Amanita thiersii Skay4041]